MDVQNASNLQIPQGEVKTIHDSTGNLLWGRLSYDVKYSGDILQNGTPSPNNPITVQIVTGTQSISINDGVNDAEYNISLGSIELCKIDGIHDYIYKSGDNWYVHKEIGKVTFNGTENWTRANTRTSGKYKMGYDNLSGLYVHPTISTETMLGYSSHFEARTEQQLNNLMDGFSGNTAGTKIFIYNSEHNTTTDDFKTWLISNNVTLYYALVTPTDTQITDSTLISQLNNVNKWLTRAGYSNTISGNLPIILDKTNL